MPRISKRTLIPLAALLILAASASAQDWKGRGRARGSVKDDAGKPVAGATVTLTYQGQKGAGPTIKSDKKGNFGYIGLITGNFTVVVEAEGYVPIEAQIRINEYDASATQPLDVVLRKADAAVSSGGNEAEANRLMGVLAAGNEKLKNKEFAAARAAYEEVMAEVKDPKQQAQLKAAIGDTYLGEGKGPEARAIFEGLLATTEDPAAKAAFRQRIARSFYLEKKIDESVKVLEEAIAADPADLASLRLIIDILVSSGREAQAEPYMARLPKGEKVDANALLNLGITAYNNGDMDAALEKFKRVLGDYPENADAWYYLGLAELGKGNNADAKSALEKFLALAPDHKSAADAKQFLEYLK
jgi:tetratricopeptide (TPR) repeat protein